jgi:hypothetical protein
MKTYKKDSLFIVKKSNNEKFFNMILILLENLEIEGYVDSQGNNSEEIILTFQTIDLLMTKFPKEFRTYRAENPLH